jgi:hypothetical protein
MWEILGRRTAVLEGPHKNGRPYLKYNIKQK